MAESRPHLEAGRPKEATAVYGRTRDARGVRPNSFVPALQAAGAERRVGVEMFVGKCLVARVHELTWTPNN